VDTSVEKREEAEHAPVLGQRTEAGDLADRRNGERDCQEPQRPQAGENLDFLNRIGAEIRETARPGDDPIEIPCDQRRWYEAGDEDERFEFQEKAAALQRRAAALRADCCRVGQ
jgi:hypothetical protein